MDEFSKTPGTVFLPLSLVPGAIGPDLTAGSLFHAVFDEAFIYCLAVILDDLFFGGGTLGEWGGLLEGGVVFLVMFLYRGIRYCGL